MDRWNELVFSLHTDTILGKLNVNLVINYWVDMLKNGQNLLDHETQKSGASHKWFDESSRLIEFSDWFLNVDSDWIISGLITNVLCIFDICWMSSCTC